MHLSFPRILKVSTLAGAVLIAASFSASPARAQMVLVKGYVPMERKISRVNANAKAGTYCTQEVKTCSDGSFVSRNPAANCSYRACPTITASNE
ncbi:MAG: hypothetical protein EOP11_20775 [Proteobacteria bacterium]|nr:MAG: hypothetical protein EOP11_20775 [Pseudomonadota bacterium]